MSLIVVCVWVNHTGSITRIAATDCGDVAQYVRQYSIDVYCILSRDLRDDLGIRHGVNTGWSPSRPVSALHCKRSVA